MSKQCTACGKDYEKTCFEVRQGICDFCRDLRGFNNCQVINKDGKHRTCRNATTNMVRINDVFGPAIIYCCHACIDRVRYIMI